MLHFEVLGKGKEPLVLLHGFMENIDIWDYMQKHLSEDFTLIKIDLPGHGKSEVYHSINPMEFMAEKVKEVVDYLNLNKFNLLGHSMGGYVSLAYADLHPEKIKSLCLFFSNTLPDSAEKIEIRERSIKVMDDNYEGFVNASIPNLFGITDRSFLEPEINFAKRIALNTNKEGVKAAQLGMTKRPNRTQILEKFDGKILIIAGKQDQAVNTKEFLKNVPEKNNIKTYVLDCGHNGQLEKPQICASIINTELL